MSNIQKHQNLTPEIQEHFKPEVLEVIKTSLCPTASDHEFLLFAHKSASYGLDPFKNEIFFIKYGNTARIQFAAEAYLSKAREKEGFQPPDTQMVHENDEFKVSKNAESKELEVVTHEIGFPRGKIIGAYSIAHRKDYRPVTVIMDIDEIAHMFTGQNKDNWNKWTSDMFGKHVQQRALKKQYGLEFDDEVIKGHEEPDQPKERKDITSDVDDYKHNEEPQIIEPEQDQAETTEQKHERLKGEIMNRFKALGITGENEIKEYIQKNVKLQANKQMTIAQKENLIKIINKEIELKENEDDGDLPE